MQAGSGQFHLQALRGKCRQGSVPCLNLKQVRTIPLTVTEGKAETGKGSVPHLNAKRVRIIPLTGTDGKWR